MKKENELLLKSRYPLLYRKELPFGLECGDGWLQLLLQLSEKIDLEFLASGQDLENYPVATQVKSKFAMLAWYGDNLTEEMQESINKACEISRSTCELCGAHGQVLVYKRWYAVYCDKHAPVGSQTPHDYKVSMSSKKRVYQLTDAELSHFIGDCNE